MIYVITGVDRKGKRFTPITTPTPQHYNIYKGTVWKLDPTTNKRTRVYAVYN